MVRTKNTVAQIGNGEDKRSKLSERVKEDPRAKKYISNRNFPRFCGIYPTLPVTLSYKFK